MADLKKRHGYHSPVMIKVLRDNGHLRSKCEAGRLIATRFRKHSVDENYFASIDSEKKAYWLGFLLADGSLPSRKHEFRLKLSMKDKSHLAAFAEDVKYTGPVKHGRDFSFGKWRDTATIRFSNWKFTENLVRAGMTPNKRLRMILPTVKGRIVRHMLRGLMDGDGSIIFDRRMDTVKLCFSGQHKVMKQIRSLVVSASKVRKNKIMRVGAAHCWTLSYSGHQAIKVARYLYGGVTRFLNRKRNILINWYSRKYGRHPFATNLGEAYMGAL